jgi:hypothetical protein
VVNGYFCNLVNLNVDADFRFLAVIPSFTAPGAPGEDFTDRELTVSNAQGGPQDDPDPVATLGNHSAIFDITGGLAGGQSFLGELTYLGETDCVKIYVSDPYPLCQGATGQFALLPNLGPGAPALLAEDRLEIRGWTAVGRFPTLSSSADVKHTSVLLTPEQRGTFLPTGVTGPFDPVALSDVSQLNTSLPLATGAAESKLVTATPSSAVREFAEVNGIDESITKCFAAVLNTVV